MRVLLHLLVALLVLGVSHAYTKTLIYNEDDLLGTCVRTCGNLPIINDKFGCKKIYECYKSSVGWNRGFVRCDNCHCKCDVDATKIDVSIRSSFSIVLALRVNHVCVANFRL